jgi:hypothetical protein
MVTDAKPSDENIRKDEFVAKKPFFNISFQSERELQNPERESYSGRDQKGESSR